MPPQRRADWLERSKLLSCLRAMRGRCYNDRHPGYKNYGARGISICDEWLEDKYAFVRWALENGYRPGLEIDRENNDGNYEPNNCRFVTDSIQASNRRFLGYSSEAKARINRGVGKSNIKRQKYPDEVRQAIVSRRAAGEFVSSIAADLQMPPNSVAWVCKSFPHRKTYDD